VVRLQLLHRDVAGEGNEPGKHIPVRAYSARFQAGGPAVEQISSFGAGQAHVTHEAEVHCNLLPGAF